MRSPDATIGVMIDLLMPVLAYRQNYVAQIRETIDAYPVPLVVVGECLQNAIDAIEFAQPQPKKGKMALLLDFDANRVTVRDNGPGFPNNPRLLFLGGGEKREGKQRGRVGVGLKVTLFSSATFTLRARSGTAAFRLDLSGPHDFEQLPSLQIDDAFPPDPDPLTHDGTEVSYTFPSDEMLTRFVDEVLDTSMTRGLSAGFVKHAEIGQHKLPSPFAAILYSYLRRFSYAADVLNFILPDGKTNFPSEGIEIDIEVQCTSASTRFPDRSEIATLFGNEPKQVFALTPTYLGAEESGRWATKDPHLFKDRLGKGGDNLETTDGLNILTFLPSKDNADFEQLVTDRRGSLPENIDEYRQRLFPKVNGVYLAIGRIPEFDMFLPGGSRRIVSANGVPTSHQIDFTSGRNQEYVRCLDIVVDVDARLNYGKTHVTDLHLISRLRRFMNDAYARTLQNAASKWVGRIQIIDDDAEGDVRYVTRERLLLKDHLLVTEAKTENDVIALFFELAKYGIWDKLRFFGLSGIDRYDGRAAIQRPCDTDSVLSPDDDSKLRYVEFKLHATSIIRDFERNQKSTNEVHMVVAWDEGNVTHKQYKFYDIEHSKAHAAEPSRTYPEVTKYIHDARGGREVQVILLKPIVDRLAKNGSDVAE